MNLNFSELTSADLDAILTTLDEIHHLSALLEERHVWRDDDDLIMDEFQAAIVEEMSRRALEDAGLVVNQMVGRGELDRYVRPDGQVGYAPPGLLGEGYGEGAI